MSEILLDRELRAKRNYISRASGPGNKTLNRRTGPNSRAIIHRLGYNTITATYSQCSDISGLSGSSLNRQFSKNKRDESKKAFERLEEIEKKICGTDPEYRRSKDEILSLREAIARQPKHKRKLSSLEDRRGKLLHFFSQRTKGKVRDKCTALHRCLGKDKSFATLTFIEHISDARAVKLLNKFLTALRERFERLNYIYVIERQPDSGRPHFHLIVNKFLPVRQINALWTLQQYNEGLSVEGISRGQVEEMITYDREHPDEKSELQKVLNPFDVKKIRNINGLSYYLTKYITKGNNSGGFGCAVWHCSRVVSRLFTKTIVSRSTFAAAGSYINSRLDKKTGELIKNKGKHEKFYSLFYIENRPFFLPDMERLEFVNWALTEGMNVSKILYYDEDGKPDLDLSNN